MYLVFSARLLDSSAIKGNMGLILEIYDFRS